MATAVSMAAGTALLLVLSRGQGWRFDYGLVVLAVMPATLLLGTLPAALALAAAAWAVCRYRWLLTAEEVALIGRQWQKLRDRLHRGVRSG